MCPFTTAHPKYLKSHMRAHTGERPFACLRCEYTSSDQSTVKQHLVNIHGEAARFDYTVRRGATAQTVVMRQCQHCDSTFATVYSLSRHVKVGCHLMIG